MHEHDVVVTRVASHLLAQPFRPFKGNILVRQLHLGHDKTLIVSMKLIHFKDIGTGLYQMTGFINHSWLAQKHQFSGILDRYLLFPLKAAHATVITNALDGDVTLIPTNSNSNTSLGDRTQVALGYVYDLEGLTLIPITINQKLSFYF